MSLTELARFFKKGIRWIVGIIFIYYLFILVLIPKTQEIIASFSQDRTPANPSFGMLDPLRFERVPIGDSNPEFILNTKNGRLPIIKNVKMPVFKFMQSQFSYLAGENAQQKASTLGYSSEELISDLKGTELRWRSLKSGGVLTINKDTQSIYIDSDLVGHSGAYPAGKLDTNTAVDRAIDIVKELGYYNETQYSKPLSTVEFGFFLQNSILSTETAADAQLAKVNLYRKIADYKILGPDPKKSLITVTLRNPSGRSDPFNYPYMQILYWDFDSKVLATYPIISVSEVWNQIRQGNGVIVNVTPKDANPFGPKQSDKISKILIDNIYIAYYETYEIQKYMQPIFVIEGKYQSNVSQGGDITIYFPAVSGNYVTGATNSK